MRKHDHIAAPQARKIFVIKGVGQITDRNDPTFACPLYKKICSAKN
jgi:hypothetical protein